MIRRVTAGAACAAFLALSANPAAAQMFPPNSAFKVSGTLRITQVGAPAVCNFDSYFSINASGFAAYGYSQSMSLGPSCLMHSFQLAPNFSYSGPDLLGMRLDIWTPFGHCGGVVSTNWRTGLGLQTFTASPQTIAGYVSSGYAPCQIEISGQVVSGGPISVV